MSITRADRIPHGGIRHTVVIPTYNRSRLLAKTISSVLEASCGRRDIEIVVIDDGSSDGTASLVASMPCEPEILYVRQPDQGFRAARARNLGLSIARGGTALLLDCGVTVQANLFDVLDGYESAGNDVVVFPVVGFDNKNADALRLNRAIGALRERDVAAALAEARRFPDIREPVFRLCGDDLSALPAPWAIAWTCCLAIPRCGPLRDIRFDENFVGWGGEDLDFALQLDVAGAVFHLERQTGALHLPHAKSETTNFRSSRSNKSYLHQKYGRHDTDLLRTVSAVDLNERLVRRAETTR